MSNDSYLFPLSFAQQRLWFLNQLVPGNAFYNLSAAVPLKFPLNHAMLERSLNEVVRRHESLRTTFVVTDDNPQQQVAAELEINIPITDLASLSPEDGQKEAERLALEEAQKPFDLESGPLIRAELLRLTKNDHVFLLTIHHIVCDGWSMSILWNELNTLYTAFASGRSSPLPELAIQYADFAVWQQEWLQGPMLEAQLSFWRRTLTDMPVLNLPTDRPRPTLATYNGAQHGIRLPAELCAELRALGRRNGVTPFMLLLAVFQVLLYRHCGQEDIVVGVPIAGRSRSELETLIGFFVNTIVMRGDLSGDPSFEELLQRTRRVALDAYANQDLPFEKLVEEIQPERDLSRNPLFQVTFQLFSTTTSSATSEGGDAALSTAQRGTAVFDLSLNLWDSPAGISGYFEYSSDLFDSETVARLGVHYTTLLGSIVANSKANISRLNLLTAGERRKLLVEWNETKRDFPSEATIHQLFEEQVTRHGERTALEDGDLSLSYLQLNGWANVLARELISRGVKPGDLIAVCMSRSAEMVVSMLAALKAGAAYVPLDPAHPDDRLGLLFEQFEARVLLTQEYLAARLSSVAGTVISIHRRDGLSAKIDAGNPGISASSRDLVYVIFTSGSTGVPKGVDIEHRGLVNLVTWHQRRFHVSPLDRATQLTGPAFDACGWEIWPYLTAGACVAIVDEEVKMVPDLLLRWLADNQISISFLPTPLAELVLQESMPADLRLRALLTGGDRLHQSPSPGLGFTLYNNYGPTEYSVVTTSCEVAPVEQHSVKPPIGRPIANTSVFILDQHQQPVPPSVWGELYVGGEGLARGYHNQPALSADRFVDNPIPGQTPAKLYRTGDLVRYQSSGSIEFRGRIDHQVKIRGYRVELNEIEAVLCQHRSVREAVVTTHQNEEGEVRLAAYFVPMSDYARSDDGHDSLSAAGTAPDSDSLSRIIRDFLQRKLPDYQVPAFFVMLDSMPLTPNGKVDVNALPKPDSIAGRGGREPAAPSNEIEEALVHLFEEILETSSVGVEDNFFSDLGGHSLLATQLMSRVRSLFDIDLPLRSFFAAPTVSSLALALEEELLAQIETLSDEEVEQLLTQNQGDR